MLLQKYSTELFYVSLAIILFNQICLISFHFHNTSVQIILIHLLSGTVD